jgi:hypothetical protein
MRRISNITRKISTKLAASIEPLAWGFLAACAIMFLWSLTGCEHRVKLVPSKCPPTCLCESCTCNNCNCHHKHLIVEKRPHQPGLSAWNQALRASKVRKHCELQSILEENHNAKTAWTMYGQSIPCTEIQIEAIREAIRNRIRNLARDLREGDECRSTAVIGDVQIECTNEQSEAIERALRP